MVCIGAFGIFIVAKLFREHLQRWGFTMQAKDVEVDEDLPNFFKVIKLSQADEIVREEENMKENFGI